jgi:methylated-DNA-[protein]-cysteine S-methyltransferase
MTGNGLAVTAARFGDDDLPQGEVPTIAIDSVKAYLDGDIAALTRVPTAQSGTVYLQHCWDVLRTLAHPITYTEFAELTGKPGAVRAAAQGCARNHIALIVPCHRVLRADGTLGGYRWGLDVKRWLLDHEAESR